jgi:hypothetical protein
MTDVDVEKAVRFLHQNGLSVEVGYNAEEERVAMRAVDENGDTAAHFEIVGGLIDGGMELLVWNVAAWRRERDDEVNARRASMRMVPMAA